MEHFKALSTMLRACCNSLSVVRTSINLMVDCNPKSKKRIQNQCTHSQFVATTSMLPKEGGLAAMICLHGWWRVWIGIAADATTALIVRIKHCTGSATPLSIWCSRWRCFLDRLGICITQCQSHAKEKKQFSGLPPACNSARSALARASSALIRAASSGPSPGAA